MSSKTYYLTGKARWAKVYEQNKDEYLGVTYFSIDLVVDDESAEEFRKTGSRKGVKHEAKDVNVIGFRRNEDNEKFPDFGGPPKVVDRDDKPFEELIGNDSIVRIKFTVYDTRMGPGTRLDAVQVLEHKPFKAEPKALNPSMDDIGVPF